MKLDPNIDTGVVTLVAENAEDAQSLCTFGFLVRCGRIVTKKPDKKLEAAGAEVMIPITIDRKSVELHYKK